MISVIIPTYNRASFLKETVQSVLDQTLFHRAEGAHPFELFVIDDGSEDETEEVVRNFGNKVFYHRQPHRGASSARNHGLQLAKGEYIAFLDSDDLWKKEKLSVQMSFFRAFPQARVCYTEEIWLRHGSRLNPSRKHRKFSGWIFDRVLPLCLLSLSSCFFRREVFEEVGGFDEDLPVCEDYDFGIRLAQRYPIYLVPAPLIIKRGGHPDQLSRKYWGMDRFRVRALEKALSLNLTPQQENLVRTELVKKCWILIQGLEKRNRREEAKKYLELVRKYGLSQS